MHTQDLKVGSPRVIAQTLENHSIQQLLSNTDFMRQFISEHLGTQQSMQQNPEVSHILDNSEILWQTLELARNLAVIQEIMQIQQPARILRSPPNPQSHVGLETVPGWGQCLEVRVLLISMIRCSTIHKIIWGATFSRLSWEDKCQSKYSFSFPSPPPSQEQQEHLPQPPQPESSMLVLEAYLQSVLPPAWQIILPEPVLPNSTNGQSHACAVEQPIGIPALPGRELNQLPQAEDKDATISLDSSNQKPDDLQQSNEQTSSQITGNMMQLLLNNPFPGSPDDVVHERAQLVNSGGSNCHFCSRLSLLICPLALANPKASVILQIEQSLQLLATEAPVLLPWVAPYLGPGLASCTQLQLP